MPRPDGPQFVFHGSTESPEEFLKAPFLHVGTGVQARQARTGAWVPEDKESAFNKRDMPEEGHYKLKVSKHSEIHPEVFSDTAANTAHKELLEQSKLEVPQSVMTSSWGMSDLDPHPSFPENARNRSEVDRVKQALSENKIVQYHNENEGPSAIINSDLTHVRKQNVSYGVPAPQWHLRRPKEREKGKQPMLPMNYTGVLPESTRTKAFKDASAHNRRLIYGE